MKTRIASRGDRLVYLQREKNGGVFPYPMYTALRDGTQTFDGVAAWSGFVAGLNAGTGVDRTLGYLVTGNFFDVLGLSADRGRLLSPATSCRQADIRSS